MDSRKPLWVNLTALMQVRWGGENLNRLARECGVSPATATRLKAQQTSVGLETLDKLAEFFEVKPGELIDPDFCPGGSTRTEPMSPMAADLARMFDAIQDPAMQDKAYAIAAAVLQLGTAQLAQRAPAPSTAADAAPEQRSAVQNPIQ